MKLQNASGIDYFIVSYILLEHVDHYRKRCCLLFTENLHLNMIIPAILMKVAIKPSNLLQADEKWTLQWEKI